MSNKQTETMNSEFNTKALEALEIAALRNILRTQDLNKLSAYARACVRGGEYAQTSEQREMYQRLNRVATERLQQILLHISFL